MKFSLDLHVKSLCRRRYCHYQELLPRKPTSPKERLLNQSSGSILNTTAQVWALTSSGLDYFNNLLLNGLSASGFIPLKSVLTTDLFMPPLLGQSPAWTLGASHFGVTSSDKCRSREVTVMCARLKGGVRGCGAAAQRPCLKMFPFGKFWNTVPAESETGPTRLQDAMEVPHYHAQGSQPLLFALGFVFQWYCATSVLWIPPHPSSAWLIPSGMPSSRSPSRTWGWFGCRSWPQVHCVLTPLLWAGLLQASSLGLCCLLLHQPLSQPWHGGGLALVEWVLSAWNRDNCCYMLCTWKNQLMELSKIIWAVHRNIAVIKDWKTWEMVKSNM